MTPQAGETFFYMNDKRVPMMLENLKLYTTRFTFFKNNNLIKGNPVVHVL